MIIFRGDTDRLELVTAARRFTPELITTFSNYLIIVDAYSKIPKLYGMDKITTEEVIDKLDMLQSRFRKIDQLLNS